MGQQILESVTRYEAGPFHVRVWRQESLELSAVDCSDIAAEIAAMPAPKMKELTFALMALPRVNAVEVTSAQNGSGLVGYNDWP